MAAQRRGVEARRFILALIAEFTACGLARLCGISDRTVRRWRDGEDWPSRDTIDRLIDRLFPLSDGSGPVYHPDMAIDGSTRVGGVGEFTIRAASSCSRPGDFDDHGA